MEWKGKLISIGISAKISARKKTGKIAMLGHAGVSYFSFKLNQWSDLIPSPLLSIDLALEDCGFHKYNGVNCPQECDLRPGKLKLLMTNVFNGCSFCSFNGDLVVGDTLIATHNKHPSRTLNLVDVVILPGG